MNPGRVESCRDCHIWIREVAADPVRRQKAMSVFPFWERYERNVASYVQVPKLDAAMARLEPEWVRSYLKNPPDLRPRLPETMPRFALTDAQVDAIVAAFAASTAEVPSTSAPRDSRVTAGEQVFVSRNCGTCHDFGVRSTNGANPMAPDLAYTRERMSPDRVAAWIRDPHAISPSATMPSFGLTADEILAVRDYILLANPGSREPPAETKAPTAVPRPVKWSEVQERVFGRICAHCHMNPDQNQGRAGPGNAGGFGFPPTGIDLETYEGVVAAADRIPAAILRRRGEARRDFVAPGEAAIDITRPDRPGMPLGLPPLSDEDIAIVLGWIEQGMPR